MNNTICLNMIVKNESKIIKRLLNSVLPIIDTYCICDTGSTDNTVQIITEFFNNNKINGEIIEEPFKNFCYNRNFSLNACYGMSDYILLLDADMVLNIKNFDKNILIDNDVIYILQGSNDFYYKNIRIIKNCKDFKYYGVTHEYIGTNNNKNTSLLGREQLFINDIGDGGSKQNKFKRDILLLLNGIEDELNNHRYYFYLANSYKDYGDDENAIKYYKKRIDFKGWKEEVWHSYYEIGNCYKEMDEMKNAISYWLDAYDYYPERLEAMYKIIMYHRYKENYVLCNLFYNAIKENLEMNIDRNDYLFLDNTVYTYKLFYEYTIFAFYNNIVKINDEILKVLNNTLDDNIRKNLLQNIQFYDLKLKQKKVIDLSNNRVIDVNGEKIKFTSSSSCLTRSRFKMTYLKYNIYIYKYIYIYIYNVMEIRKIIYCK